VVEGVQRQRSAVPSAAWSREGLNVPVPDVAGWRTASPAPCYVEPRGCFRVGAGSGYLRYMYIFLPRLMAPVLATILFPDQTNGR